jgi:hypothetical protein
LLALIDREGDPENKNIQLLVDIFRRFGPEPEVGSYVMKDEGKQLEFTSDSEREALRKWQLGLNQIPQGQ